MHKMLSSKHKFCENWFSDNSVVLKGMNALHPCFPYLLTDLCEIQYINLHNILFSTYEFCLACMENPNHNYII